LSNGSYQWQIRDYGTTYGFGTFTDFQGFTLNILNLVVLDAPKDTLTSWDKSFNWTGVSGATWYFLHVQTSDGSNLFGQWLDASSVCSGTACSVVPEGLSLSNGSYQWRIRDYGTTYGFGAFTDFQGFVLNTP
jgi:hypothetical protein